MKSKKQRAFNPLAAATLVLVFAICGCKSQQAQPTNHAHASAIPAGDRLQNGAYAVLREAPTPREARVEGVSQRVLTYDRRKYGGAPPNEPLTYVTIDPKDYVPLIIEGAPELKADEQGKSVLSVSLARKNVQRAEDFTRAHLGGRIAMVVDGEIVTLHKIRSVSQTATCRSLAAPTTRAR